MYYDDVRVCVYIYIHMIILLIMYVAYIIYPHARVQSAPYVEQLFQNPPPAPDPECRSVSVSGIISIISIIISSNSSNSSSNVYF